MSHILDTWVGDFNFTPGRHVFKFSSKKMGAMVKSISPNEHNFCYFLEFDDRVSSYISQPKPIIYDLYQEGHSYRADFMAELILDKLTAYEVKPKGYTASQCEINKFREIKQCFYHYNINFVIVTGDYIERGKTLKNMKFLKSLIGKTIPAEIYETLKTLTNTKKIQIEKIKMQLSKKHKITYQESLKHIYTAIVNRIIFTDISDEMIGNSSFIGKYHEEKHDRYWNAIPCK
ncbi:hypothetical protein GCM10023116_20440 [Kistimonas scapharcae]|uniref:TnsA endonuclease N-terminal domain-containing protein n=1 Tax=Kistimonas scapharcae TaxID=1036133 RepID=A0ABP8V2V8_9GAMM